MARPTASAPPALPPLRSETRRLSEEDTFTMIRRLALVAAAALVAAPFISVGSASAAETVIARCTSAKGSTKLLPGLGHDKKSQTGTSPDTKTGATASWATVIRLGGIPNTRTISSLENRDTVTTSAARRMVNGMVWFIQIRSRRRKNSG